MALEKAGARGEREKKTHNSNDVERTNKKFNFFKVR